MRLFENRKLDRKAERSLFAFSNVRDLAVVQWRPNCTKGMTEAGERERTICMKYITRLTAVFVVMSVLLPNTASAQSERSVDKSQSEPAALGHPLGYWMKAIRDRELEKSDLAFDALVQIGPAAWRAVPELREIVATPFSPIRMGKDSNAEMYAKLLDIHLRAGAVDSLGAIGNAASPTAEAMIRWGLTIRVVPPETGPVGGDPFYLELVGVDVLERMRVAGAVARLGSEAADAVQALIDSPDNEKRKFAAAILNDTTVTVATDLMRSESCEDRLAGLSLLSAMWPVVAKDHLLALQDLLKCMEDDRPDGVAPADKTKNPIEEKLMRQRRRR
jgi:hypothetical protein